MSTKLNDDVRQYWEKEPCGTGTSITGNREKGGLAWYEQVEEHRYSAEPFIHSVAQFTRHHGKRVLEVGVGAGTDHLQFARAGATCHGVDLTDAAIETTRGRLALYGFKSELRRMDAEHLPFEDDWFDVVYSWGVIHHSAHPDRITQEIRRVLKPGGLFLGMMYGRRSVVGARVWLRHALLKGRPFRSVADVIWNHVESVGTKAYTVKELRALFDPFRQCSANPILTVYDTAGLPQWLTRFFPDDWGWFVLLRAVK